MTAFDPAALALISPQEAFGYVFKGLTVVGGAVLGGLFAGLAASLLTRLLTAKPMPTWARRVCQLLGAVVAGWLVYLWASGLGGPGFGGGSGLAPGDNGGERQPAETRKKPVPPTKETEDSSPPGVKERVRVEVLGEKALRALGQERLKEGPYRGYRVEADDGTSKLVSLKELQNLLEKKPEDGGGRRVEIVIYKDTPLPEVDPLVRWLERNEISKKEIKTNEYSPEARQKR